MATTFADMHLSPEVLRDIDALGFEAPSPIQQQAIPLLMEGGDVLAQAQTGTGKTAAFALPIIERIDIERREVQAIVLAPTRELAIQVAESMQALGKSSGLIVLPIYGGQAYDRQLRPLRAGVHVVVGTPGRVMDHMRRGTLSLSAVRIFILDEADEMLDMGFVEDIDFILEQVPDERQIALFSATVPHRIETLAGRYLRNPERITIARDERTASQTRQFFVETPYHGKLDVLTRLLDLDSPRAAIIFCRTKRGVDTLEEELQARGHAAVAIHGDINQAQRERLLRTFRDGRATLLIATEVAARGLDIPDVTHVFNYDIPDDADAYVHRIGRTGRMGREGDAITFISRRELRQLRFIERAIQKRLEPLRIPSNADISERKRELFGNTIVDAVESGVPERFTDLATELAETHDPLTIAAAAMQLAVDASAGRWGGGPGGPGGPGGESASASAPPPRESFAGSDRPARPARPDRAPADRPARPDRAPADRAPADRPARPEGAPAAKRPPTSERPAGPERPRLGPTKRERPAERDRYERPERPSRPPERRARPDDFAGHGGHEGDDSMARVHVDVGRAQGVRPQDIVGAFTAEANISGSAIGSIKLFDGFAFVDLEPSAARAVLSKSGSITLRGHDVRVTPAIPAR